MHIDICIPDVSKLSLRDKDILMGLAGAGGNSTDRLTRIEKELLNMDAAIQSQLDTLAADITDLAAADEAAEALLTGLSGQLATAIQNAKDAGASPEQLQALSDLHAGISTNTAKLSAAVVANTARAV